MKKPKMILFDYGGTLLCEPEWDMLRGEQAVFQHVIKNPHHYTPEYLCSWESAYFQSLQKIRDLDAELTEIQLMRLKYELHGIQLDISYEDAEFVFWSNTAPMTEKCLMPNIEKVLSYLHNEGIRTGVISNIGWTGISLKKRIDTLLPENHFEFIIASSDYGLRKPDVKLFQLALEKASLMPDEVWFCGNTYDKDIEGAQSAGISALLYQGDGRLHSFQEGGREGIPLLTDWNDLIRILKNT